MKKLSLLLLIVAPFHLQAQDSTTTEVQIPLSSITFKEGVARWQGCTTDECTNRELMRYMSDKIHLPDDVNFETATVPSALYIAYCIDTTGKVDEVTVVRSSGLPSFDDHVVDVFYGLPQFTPATYFGKAVRVKYHLPIHVCLRRN